MYHNFSYFVSSNDLERGHRHPSMYKEPSYSSPSPPRVSETQYPYPNTVALFVNTPHDVLLGVKTLMTMCKRMQPQKNEYPLQWYVCWCFHIHTLGLTKLKSGWELYKKLGVSTINLLYDKLVDSSKQSHHMTSPQHSTKVSSPMFSVECGYSHWYVSWYLCKNLGRLNLRLINFHVGGKDDWYDVNVTAYRPPTIYHDLKVTFWTWCWAVFSFAGCVMAMLQLKTGTVTD